MTNVILLSTNILLALLLIAAWLSPKALRTLACYLRARSEALAAARNAYRATFQMEAEKGWEYIAGTESTLIRD